MNMINQLEIPTYLYRKVLFCSAFQLDIPGLELTVYGDGQVVRIFRRFPSGKYMAINIDVPYYNKKHPEKLQATEYNLFRVTEYTKIEAYESTELNMEYFKDKFNDCLNKICNLKES